MCHASSHSRHTSQPNESVLKIEQGLNRATGETCKFHAYTVNKVQSILSGISSDLFGSDYTQDHKLAERITSRINTSPILRTFKLIALSTIYAITGLIAIPALIAVPVITLIACTLALGPVGFILGVGASAFEIMIILGYGAIILDIANDCFSENNFIGYFPGFGTIGAISTHRENIRHENLVNSQLISNIRTLSQCLDPHNATQKINKDDLLKLTIELFNLKFISDLEPYQEARNNLIQYFKKNEQSVDSLLQSARERDKEMLDTLQHSISKTGSLSIDKLEQIFELITEPCPLGQGHYDDALTALQSKLFTKLILEQIPLLIKNNFAVPSETVYDPGNASNTSMHGEQEACSRIQNDIDKLHHISMIMKLLDILSKREKIKPTLSVQDHCDIEKCLKFYEEKRKAVMSCPQVKTDKCDNDTAAPKTPVWALRPLARRLNRSWLANQPQSTKTMEDDSPEDMLCAVSLETLDRIAPSSTKANNIVLLATDGFVYKSDILFEWSISNGNTSFDFKSPSNKQRSHLVDIVPSSLVVPMKQFAVRNLLPKKSKLVPRLLRRKVVVSSKASNRPFWGGGAHHMKG